MRTLSRIAGAVLAVGAALSAQTSIPVYFPDNTTTGSGNAFPWNTQSAPVAPNTGHTCLIVYPAATLLAQGGQASMKLVGLAFMPQTGSGNLSAPNARVFVGHLAPQPIQSTAWISNMADPTSVWDTTVDGPLTTPGWTGLTWAPIPFSPSTNWVWDGVRDIVVMVSHGGGQTGGYTLLSSPTPYPRHVNSQFMPAPGVATTSTGVLGPRMRMTFECPPIATTSGNGAGDLTLIVNTPFSGAIVEGYTLLSSTQVGNAGSGPLFGLWPDALTFAAIPTTPAVVGDPLHWVANHGIPGVWPLAPLQFPSPSLAFLAGQTWDVVLVGFGPNFTPAERSCVARLVW